MHEDEKQNGPNITGPQTGDQSAETGQLSRDWPSECVSEAQEACPVPKAVADALTEQLNGPASERSLKGLELTTLSQQLLAALAEASNDEAAK